MHRAATGVVGPLRSAWAFATLLMVAAPAAAQNTCQLIDSRLLNFVARGTPAEAIFISRPIISCSDGARIVSDSAIIVPAQNLSRLFGNVRFAEESRSLTADRADYYSRQDRLHAWGRVVLSDPEQGSTIDGDTVVYLRAGDVRLVDRITVTGREVHATLVPRPAPPVVAEIPDSMALNTLASDSANVTDSLRTQPGLEIGPRTEAERLADSVATAFFTSTLTALDLIRGGTLMSDRLATGILVEKLRESGTFLGVSAAELLSGPPIPPRQPSADEPSRADSVSPDDTTQVVEPLEVLPPSISDSSGVGIPDSLAPAGADSVTVPSPDSVASVVPLVVDSVQTPYDVTAHRQIVIDGGNSFEAEGDVAIERDALRAFGDRVRYDQNAGELYLLGNARSEGESYDLTANSIVVSLPAQQVREVAALQQAVLTTGEIDLTAPRIRMFVESSQLERLVAGFLSEADSIPVLGTAPLPGTEPVRVGLTPRPGDTIQPTALAEDFRLSGDSIDVETPRQELERVVAAGRARGVSLARDSLNTDETPEVVTSDWLVGDTIIATFRSAPAAGEDTAVAQVGAEPAGREYELERLEARGAARTLYRLAPSDSTRARADSRLAIHYVVGEAITIEMVGGEVERMRVRGQTQGIHLEPLPPTADSTAADSASTPDSVGVAPDTAGVADSAAVQPDTSEVSGPVPDTTGVADAGWWRGSAGHARRTGTPTPGVGAFAVGGKDAPGASGAVARAGALAGARLSPGRRADTWASPEEGPRCGNACRKGVLGPVRASSGPARFRARNESNTTSEGPFDGR